MRSASLPQRYWFPTTGGVLAVTGAGGLVVFGGAFFQSLNGFSRGGHFASEWFSGALISVVTLSVGVMLAVWSIVGSPNLRFTQTGSRHMVIAGNGIVAAMVCVLAAIQWAWIQVIWLGNEAGVPTSQEFQRYRQQVFVSMLVAEVGYLLLGAATIFCCLAMLHGLEVSSLKSGNSMLSGSGTGLAVVMSLLLLVWCGLWAMAYEHAKTLDSNTLPPKLEFFFRELQWIHRQMFAAHLLLGVTGLCIVAIAKRQRCGSTDESIVSTEVVSA